MTESAHWAGVYRPAREHGSSGKILWSMGRPIYRYQPVPGNPSFGKVLMVRMNTGWDIAADIATDAIISTGFSTTSPATVLAAGWGGSAWKFKDTMSGHTVWRDGGVEVTCNM